MTFLFEYFTESGNQALTNFNYGFIAGVIVFFLMALFTRLVFFTFFTGNKCPGIRLRAERGDIFFTTSAIADMVRIASSSFADIRLDKIHLIKEKEVLSLKITVSLINRDNPPAGTLELLKDKILDTLGERLGINSIKYVKITVGKIYSHAD